MNKSKVKIGSAIGRHPQFFERTSGLRREDFADPPWYRRIGSDGWVLIWIVLCLLVGIIVTGRPL